MSFKDKFNSKFRIGKSEQAISFIFDENSFDLRVEGGPTQSSLIRISATMNMGESKGKLLDLHCKWFNKTNNDIREIVGITGHSYQPCMADVGTIIHVQCMPSLPGKQYQGMPIIKEIGPLSVDKESEEEAREHVQAQQATFFINILSFKIDGKQSRQSQGFLKLLGNKLLIQIKNSGDSRSELVNLEYTELYPNYVFNRVNNKELRIDVSPTENLMVSVQDHVVRDVICLTTKMMLATKIVQKLNSEESLNLPTSPVRKCNSTTTDLFQIGELTRQNRDLLTEKQQLEKRCAAEKDEKQTALQKMKHIEERLESLNKNYFVLEEEVKKLQDEKSKSQHHYTYLENEIKIARAENLHFSSELETKTKILEQYTEKLRRYEQQQQQKPYEILQKELSNVVKENTSLNSSIIFLTSERERLEELVKSDTLKIEELQGEITYLEKKHALLASQKIEQLNSFDQSHTLKAFEERQKLRERQMLKLQQQIRALIEENNERQTQSPTKSSDKPSKKPKKSEMVEVQKVANRLAEAITEKDLVNEQLRQVNRQLIERLATMERKNLELEQVKHRPN